MQTFLPYADFIESARCLDDKRLFKQAVEAMQLVRALDGTAPKSGWRNHPAAKMWAGYVPHLKVYYNAILLEVIRRKKWRLGALRVYDLVASGEVVEAVTRRPAWIGSERFHRAHRSNLLRKNAVFYGVYEWGVKPTLPYVWPKNGDDPCPPLPTAPTKPPVGKRLL